MILRTLHTTPVNLLTVLALLAGVVCAHAQLPVRTRHVQLLSNNNANYTALRSADGQTVNWSLIQPATVGTTGSLQLSTVSGSDAQLSWLAPGAAGYILGITAGIPAWVDPASYLTGSFWTLLGNTGTNPATNFVGTTDAQPLVIRTTNTERLRVNATGELGIGTTAAAGYSLHVGGVAGTPNVRLTSISGAAAGTVPAGFDRIMLSNATGDVSQATLSAVVGSTGWLLSGNAIVAAGVGAGQSFIGTTNAQPLVIGVNTTEIARFSADGLGIGTTAAAGFSLHVNGTQGTANVRLGSLAGVTPTATVPAGYDRVLIANATGDVLETSYSAVVGTSAWTLLGNAGTNPATNFVGTTDAQPLVIRTTNTERLRVNATGELGIGTTAAAGYSLHVGGVAGTPNVRLTSISGVAAGTVPAGFDRIMLSNATGDVSQATLSAVVGSTGWLLSGNAIVAAGVGAGQSFIGTTNAQPLVIGVNTTEIARFSADGLGIGTTAAAGFSLHVNGTQGTANVRLGSLAGVTPTATVPAGYDRVLIANATGDVLETSYSAVVGTSAWTLLGNTGTNPATNFVGTTDAQPLVIRTTNTERLRVNATGELGIGTTAAAGYSLHVGGVAGTPNVRLTSISGVAAGTVPAGFDRIMLSNATGDVSQATLSAVVGSTGWLLSGNPIVAAGVGAGQSFIGTTNAQPLVIGVNTTEIARFSADGLGIGTTAAAGYSLHVGGVAGTPNVRLTSISGVAAGTVPAGFDRIMLSNATGDVSQATLSAVVGSTGWLLSGNPIVAAGVGAGQSFIGTTNAQPLVIGVNTTEIARFSADGLGIGTTAAAGFSLHVNGTQGTANVRLGSLAGATPTATVPAGYDRVLIANATGDVLETSYSAVVGTSAWTLLGNAGTNPATNFVGTTDAQPLVIRTTNTERLRVNATGELGIGTTAAAGYSLHVGGVAGTPNVRLTSISGVAAGTVPAGFDRIMLSNATGDVSQATLSAVVGSTGWLLSGNPIVAAGVGAGQSFIGTTNAQPLVIGVNTTEIARFSADGLGIGTTAAAGFSLHVNGTQGTANVRLGSIAGATPTATVPAGYDRVLIANATGDVLETSYSAVVGTSAWTLLGNAGTNPATNFVGTTDAQPLVIRTTNTERLRVNATGELGIGTTAAAGYNLHVGGVAGTPNVRLTSISGVAAGTVPAGFDRIMLSNATGDVSQATLSAVVGSTGWLLSGNAIVAAGVGAGQSFIGTTNAQPLVIGVNTTEIARFSADGLGIGTTAAAGFSLHVNGTQGTANVRLGSLAGVTPTATVPAGYDRVLIANATGDVLETSYSAVVGTTAWSLLGNAGTNPATTFLGTTDAQPLVIRTTNTERLRVNATGELGIGTTAAAGYSLHVGGVAGTPNVRLTSISGVASGTVPAGFDRIMLSNATGDVSQATLSAVVGSTGWLLSGNAIVAAGVGAGQSFIGTTNAQPLVIGVNTTEIARFSADGLGIGTTAAAGFSLHVNGTQGTANVRLGSIAGATPTATVPAGYDRVLIANATGDVLETSYSAVVGTTAWSLLGNASTNPATTFLGTTDAQPLVIRTTNTERLRVNATGELGIGTTAAAGYNLHVGGVAGTPNVRLTSLASAPVTALSPGEGVVTADNNGDLRKRSASDVLAALGIAKGIYTIGVDATSFVVSTGAFDLLPGAVINVTVRGPAAPAVHAMITAVNPGADNFTIVTSATIGIGYSIHWTVMNP